MKISLEIIDALQRPKDQQIKELVSMAAHSIPQGMTVGDSIKFTLFNAGFKANIEGLTFLKECCEEMIKEMEDTKCDQQD
jgi:UDP-N-acetyl-D-mannosaminuronic acid transferase (WecB/TagA/CpsF family)